MGWTTIRNGELLALAAAEFDIFVTVDRNLSFQQHLGSYPLAVIVLGATSNRLADLQEGFRAQGFGTIHLQSSLMGIE